MLRDAALWLWVKNTRYQLGQNLMQKWLGEGQREIQLALGTGSIKRVCRSTTKTTRTLLLSMEQTDKARLSGLTAEM